MSLDEETRKAKKSHGLFEIPYIHANTANTCHPMRCEAIAMFDADFPTTSQ
jgi:hypothetical protein